MKKLFTNYNFEFEKNEKKLLTNFCKQAVKQLSETADFLQKIKLLTRLSKN